MPTEKKMEEVRNAGFADEARRFTSAFAALDVRNRGDVPINSYSRKTNKTRLQHPASGHLHLEIYSTPSRLCAKGQLRHLECIFWGIVVFLLETTPGEQCYADAQMGRFLL
jgi:hypothetical protein